MSNEHNRQSKQSNNIVRRMASKLISLSHTEIYPDLPILSPTQPMDGPNPCPTLINRLITRQSVTCVQEPYILLTTKINENYLKCELRRGRDSERNTDQDAQTSTIGL